MGISGLASSKYARWNSMGENTSICQELGAYKQLVSKLRCSNNEQLRTKFTTVPSFKLNSLVVRRTASFL